MRFSDWSSDVCSADLLKPFNIFGGSAFADDYPAAGSFDVVVNGSLSTRGRWVNDLNSGTDGVEGAAFIDGGSISLEAAPRVSLAIDARESIDISGSILIRPGARIDVSGGGSVAHDGAVAASATGGTMALSTQADYFPLSP